MPFRITFKSQCCTAIETLKDHAQVNAHHPRIERLERRKLAVCGGGPGLAQHLDELRAWDGDIWAVNLTAPWLVEQGISATLFTVDGDEPHPSMRPVPRALLATACSPRLFGIQKDAQLQTFDLAITHPNGFPSGCCSVTSTQMLALYMGYREVSYFGCEGSFELDRDHIDRHDGSDQMLIVRAGGRDFVTTPPFFLQCEELSRIFAMIGHVFINRSGGLVTAMTEHPDTWEVVGVSAALKRSLEEINGHMGLFDTPYTGIAA